MIKDDLVKTIAAKFNLSLNLTGKIVQTVLDEIVSSLVSDSRIELRRFGVFGLKKQKPRVITLPSGRKITRPAQKVITFNPSSNVKKKLNPPTKKTTKEKKGVAPGKVTYRDARSKLLNPSDAWKPPAPARKLRRKG